MLNAVALLLCSNVLATSPQPELNASYWFFLDDVPVGTVAVTRKGNRYEYSSTHFFGGSPRKPKTSAYRVELEGRQTPEDRIPVSLFLVERPKSERCEDVVDELSGATGTACVNDRLDDMDIGNALGASYRARYADGILAELSLGNGVFKRGEGIPPPPPDIFAAGIPVSGVEGPLAFLPEQPKRVRYRPMIPTLYSRDRIEEAVKAARATLQPNETGACVRLAEEVVRRVGRSAAEVVYGVVLDGPRVYPHAWVRVLSSEREEWFFDPAMDVEVKPTTHLEIEREIGATYLELWSGNLKVTRVAPVAKTEGTDVTRTE